MKFEDIYQEVSRNDGYVKVELKLNRYDGHAKDILIAMGVRTYMFANGFLVCSVAEEKKDQLKYLSFVEEVEGVRQFNRRRDDLS